MEDLQVTVLGSGTSQGVPVIACECDVCKSQDPKDKRLRSSILVSHQGTNVVIDTGPDFRQQMLVNEVNSLEAVVFTHEHKDHVAGMDDIRAYNFKQKKDMDVFATDQVQGALKRDFHYVFDQHKYPGVPQVKLHTVTDEPFNINGLSFIPIDVMHYRMPVKAYRIGDFAYVTDANFIAPKEMNKLKGVKYLIINALRKEKHISHFNLDEALELIDQIGPQKAYLTHISHLMGKHADVNNELPPNVEIAFDGQVISCT